MESSPTQNSSKPVIAITTGEPAGIGPELCMQVAAEQWPARLVLIGNSRLLEQTAKKLGRDSSHLPSFDPLREDQLLSSIDLPLRGVVKGGKLNTANSAYVVETLNRACAGCLRGEFKAMVTAPVHKGVINDAGIRFTGHTEFLARQTNSRQILMLLAAGKLRVALVTTHVPLRRVADSINRERVQHAIRLLARELKLKFAIDSPKILVCGLNPHAGEGGHLGREDMDVIEPAIRLARTEGIDAVGPLPADTAFTHRWLADADAVLTMYHDQGLPVLKYAGFGSAVNITLGLPIVRTSVDHGTALDVAAKGVGRGEADAGSLRAALATAIELANQR